MESNQFNVVFYSFYQYLMRLKTIFSAVVGLLALLFGQWAQAQGAAWVCDGKFYQVRAAAGQPSTLFSLVNPPDNSAFQVTPLFTLSGASVTPSANTFVNGLAYRRQDNFLYALHRGAVGGTDAPNQNMYRIGQSSAVSLGAVTGLPAGFSPTAGDFDDLGVYYTLQAGNTNVMYRINVTTVPPSVINSVTLSVTVPNVGDFSYRPNASTPGSGTFTGLTAGANAVQITPSGAVTTFTVAGLPAGAGWGTTWADASGFFYGYDNLATGGNAVYRINLAANTAVVDSTGVVISGSDGASCINPSTTSFLAGTVFVDPNNNGVLEAGESGLGIAATPLTVYAINGFGQVAGKATISPSTGAYTITGLFQSANYQLVLANTSTVAIGAPAPAASLPAGYLNTGESLNAVADGTANGQYPGVTTPVTGGTSGLNFGVRGADMTPVFSGFPATSTAGQTITGVLTCTNASGGAAASTATCGASATSPAGLLVTVGTCTPPSPVTSLAAGSSITCPVSIKVPNTGSFTVTGVTGALNDTNGGTTTGGNNSTTYTSTVALVANLNITKSNGQTGVTAGTTVTYALVISNAGPSPADGALVKDPAVAGLSCTTLACPPAGQLNGAVCPSGPAFTLANLQGAAGIALPTLPSGGSLTLTLTCGVTATGQ